MKHFLPAENAEHHIHFCETVIGYKTQVAGAVWRLGR